MSRVPRVLLGCATTGMGLMALVAFGLLGFAGWVGTTGGETWLARRLEDLGTWATTGGSLELGDLSIGSHGLRVDDLALRDAQGKILMGAGRIVAEFQPWSLRSGALMVPRLRLDDAVLDLTADAQGVLDLTRLFGGPSTQPSKPFELPIDFVAPDVAINGLTIRYATASGPLIEVSGLHGQTSLQGQGDRITLGALRATGQVARPGPVPVTARGEVVWDASDGLSFQELQLDIPHGRIAANGGIGSTIDLGLRIDRLEARALDPFTGDVGIGGVWSGSVGTSGTSERFEVVAAIRGIEQSQGAIALHTTIDRTDPLMAWQVMAELAGFHVEQLYTKLASPVVVDGLVEIDAHGARFGEDLEVEGTWKGGEQVLYGQAVSSVDTAFAVRGTELSLDGDLEGIIGQLGVVGTIDLRQGPIDLDLQGTLDPARLAALGTPGLDGDGRFAAKLQADFKQDPVVVSLDGRVDYAPFLYPNLKIAELTVPLSVSVVRGVVEGVASLHGTGVDALGLVGATIDGDRLTFQRLPSGRVTAQGPLTVASVAYGDWVTAGWADADFRFAMERGHRQLDAAVRLAEYTLAGRPGTDGDLAIEMRDDQVNTDIALRDFGRQVLDTTVSMDLATQRVALGELAFAPTPRATWRSEGASMLLVEGGVEDLQIRVQSELGAVEASGRLATQGPLDGQVTFADFQLDHVAELYPEDWDGLAGLLDLRLRLAGEAEAPVLQGEVALQSLFANDSVRWLDASGSFRVEDGALSPELSLAVAGEPLGVLTGALPLQGGLDALALGLQQPIDLQLALVPGDFERLARALPSLDGQQLPQGRLSGVIEATDKLVDPLIHVAGVSEIAVPGWTLPGRMELDLTRRASELAFEADLREGLTTRAEIDGSGLTRLGEAIGWLLAPRPDAAAPEWSDPELYLDEMNISAVLTSVPVGSLGAALGSQVALDGDLVGGFVVRGSPSRPVVDGGLQWLEPMVGGQKLEGAYLGLQPHSGEGPAGYRIDALFAFPGASGIEVRGDLPVAVDFDRSYEEWSTGELALDVSGSGIPVGLLAELNPRFQASSARGLVQVEGQVGGTLADPKPVLVATIQEGNFADRVLGIEATGIDARVAFDAEQVQVDHIDFSLVPLRRFQARQVAGELGGIADELAGVVVEQPRVRVTGTAELEQWALSGLSGKVSLSGGPWLVATPDTVIRTDGEVLFSGQWPELTVRGELDLVHGRVGLDAAAFLTQAPLSLDPSLTVLRGEQPPVVAPAEEPPLYAAFDVNVNVDLNRNLELTMGMPFVTDFGDLGAAVSRVDLSSRVGGQLEIVLEQGSPTLIGAVELVEGKARMLRSTFDLQRGTITFAGGDPYEDAILDLSAQMSSAEADLAMAIQGTPPQPSISFRSERYPDPTDQMTILLTGRPPEDLTAQAGAGAARALAGVAFSSLFVGQSLGTFSIEPDGSVRVGVPLTPSIFAASSLSPTPNPSENSVTFEVEWTVAPKVVAEAGVGNRRSWGDLFWEIRF